MIPKPLTNLVNQGSAVFMSQQDSDLDQAINDGPSVAEPSNATGDILDVRQKSAEEEAAEAEAAAAERARRMLQQQIAAVDDAEEVCVFLVEDTLDAIFQEMQVSAENASVFVCTSAWASDSVFAGVSMGSTRASASLDRFDSVGRTAFNGVRQQVLKLDEDGCDDVIGPVQQSPGKRRVSRSEAKPEPSSASLRFLRRLLAFVESSSDQVAREFMMFPAAQYVQRSVHARGTSHAAISSTRATGDWEIPSGSVGAFLTHLIDRCHVRVLPSTVSAVHEANTTAIDAKVRAKATLSLNQITHFVRKAVLAAEQEAEAAMRETQQRQLQEDDDAMMNSSRRTFQTELAGGYDSTRPSGREGVRSGLQSCFMEEALPVAAAIDRNVPGSIARKSPDASQPPKGADQKQLARRVIMALMPGPKGSSRWLGLRTRVVHDSDPNVVQVAVDADMKVSMDSKSGADGTGVVMPTKPALSPKKPSVQFAAAAMAAASPSAAPRPSKLIGRSFSTASNNKEERSVGSPITIITAEPDTGALSNIFSLGTPRQLTGDELARQNDILVQLEREELQHQRRLATASIAAITFPPTACPSDAEERAFRAYVTANSSITTGVDFDLELPIASIASGEEASPPPVAPRRPEKKNTNQSPNRRDRRASGAAGGRSMFEVAFDPPAFVVHDGNARADALKEFSGMDMAKCSPNRKVSPSKHAGSPSPPAISGGVVAGAGAVTGDSGLSPIRPVQSAGHHLPQLDMSRLAVGVRAVVRGVEKRGPRQNPSRQSRLKLHNYNVSDAGAYHRSC